MDDFVVGGELLQVMVAMGEINILMEFAESAIEFQPIGQSNDKEILFE